MSNIYNDLSEERKKLQHIGELPDWVTTHSYQMLKEKYLDKNESLKDRFRCIAKTAASYMPFENDIWEDKFYNLLWKGWLAPSTPVMANMGKRKGCAVSCSGGYIGDSVSDFYMGQHEVAMLSKNGFGTSGYMGDIRPRGAPITDMKGGASGIVPVFKDYVQVARDISQGSQRRGAWAGYVPIDHGDFEELVNHIAKNPDDANIGWCVSNKYIEEMDAGNEEKISRWQKAMKLKMISGKGYWFFPDKVNALNPQCWKDKGITVDASNLCTEITLYANHDETFTCVLSSKNLAKYDEWKGTSAVFDSLVFLYCVALDFIKVGSTIPGLEKAVKFTKKNMALGLGALGFHTYLQDNMIAIESLEAHMKNIEIFKYIDDETLKASQWLAGVFGECENTIGYGIAATHRTAIAPNLSSAVLCGAVSQGIEPVYKNAFVQGGAAGEMKRINPSLLKLMRHREVYNAKTVKDIIDNEGSVQHVDWLNDHEKAVFKTAFEIDQEVLLRLASTRQKYICQAQSINLFFSADEKEEYIAYIHYKAFHDPMIKSLYYIRSESGVQASKGECVSCAS